MGSKHNGFSGFFHVLNRGKRSIALDLGCPEGCDIVRHLAAEADVVLQNFRPGVADRLGIGYADLSVANSGLVYLSISGFGQNGPRAAERAYDPIIQVYSSIADIQGRIHFDHAETPAQVNMLLLDKLTAWTGMQAITAALLARAKSGEGQHVELSMLDVTITFAWSDTAADLKLHQNGRFLYATNRSDPSIAAFQVNGDNGSLVATGWYDSGGSFPRSIAIDPTGQFLLAANEHADTIVGFRVDQDSGTLRRSAYWPNCPAPLACRLPPLPAERVSICLPIAPVRTKQSI